MCDIGQEFYPGEDWFEWIARHRVERACVECPFPIRAGEKHVVVFHGPYEHERAGEWHRFFVHRACDKLKDLAEFRRFVPSPETVNVTLLGGVRCVLVKSIVGQGDGCEVCDDMPACCDECGADFTYANGAVCLNCFEKAHT